MSLVPLSNYVFFLAQLQTFGYLAVYFGVLALRHRCVCCWGERREAQLHRCVAACRCTTTARRHSWCLARPLLPPPTPTQHGARVHRDAARAGEHAAHFPGHWFR